MLRITRINNSHSVTLKLEGTLREAWAGELREELARSHREFGNCGGLDLTNVTFVDQTGADLLREAIERGVRIVACSSFVAELLQVRKP